MEPPFAFEPALQLDLEVPVRIEVVIPLNLLPRFDPSIQPVAVPGNIRDVMTPLNPLKALKPAALIIAESVSRAVFGSTEPVHSHPFQNIGHWDRDGTLRAVFFYLNYRLGIDDIGLNPEYIRAVAKDVDGKLIFRTSVLTGERRKMENEEYEGPAPAWQPIALL